jgi:O-antigen ligase
MVVLLGLAFALGGSARGDVAQLMVLRPAAVLLLGYGLMTLRRHHVRAHPVAWILGTAVVALPALQLIPLPPDFWRNLPGRELIAEVDRAAGMDDVWRPLTLTPLATRNALFASLVPLAGFVLGMQLDDRGRARLLPIILILGAVSALAGLAQVMEPAWDWLYLYPTTNAGREVGLFANRNHQALLLSMMLPMLAVFGLIGRARWRLIVLGCGVLLIPLILLAGSRLGLIAAVIALIAIPVVLAGPSHSPEGCGRRWRLASPVAGRRGPVIGAVLAVAGITLVGVTIWQGRGEAWTRLADTFGGGDQRVQILPTLGEMFATYFPAGSGMGSFERVFQIHEPDALLGPAVVNHAHNDWAEVVLDGGLPAALVIGAAVVVFAMRSVRVRRGEWHAEGQRALARLGLLLIALQGAASLFDYPLRTPIHAVLFTVAVLWAIADRSTGIIAEQLDASVKTHRNEALATGGRMA